MRAPLLLTLVALLASGCSTDAATGEIDAITPGVWDARGEVDRMLFWVRNPTSDTVEGSWSLELEDGPLPESWDVAFDDPDFTLKPKGTKEERPDGGSSYPDWAYALASLDAPGDAAGTHKLRVKAGPYSAAITATVAAARVVVSAPDDAVNVKYDGKFKETGTRFDQGNFDTILGGGETVPGFDFGLMGLAVGEKASLHLPPALGYGYDQTSSRLREFNGKWLIFDVELTRID